jgi:ATP-dependent helicase/DNAse subunit B
LKVEEKDFEKIDEFIEDKFEKTLKNILIKRDFDIEMNIAGSTSSPWKPKPQILCGWCDYKSIC